MRTAIHASRHARANTPETFRTVIAPNTPAASGREKEKVMNKMIVTVFNNEKSAYEALRALTALHNEGSLTLHAAAVVAKDAQGRVSVKEADDQGPAGTFFGLVTGSLIGLLAGPVGLAVGATAGTVTGSIYDLATLGIGEDFLAEVSQNLTPGKVAVVADADEEWVTPLDTRMDTLGGVVFRRARGEFIDAQIEREMAADRAELAALKAEYQQSVGEAKAKVKAKLDGAEKRFDARRALIKERIDAFEREGEAKIKALAEQAARAKAETKAKLEQRVAKARADHKARSEKLHQAWQLVKEAAVI
jgi:uncharacterized membrane protein